MYYVVGVVIRISTMSTAWLYYVPLQVYGTYMPTVAAQHDTGKAEEEGWDHRRTERGVECPGQLLHAAE